MNTWVTVVLVTKNLGLFSSLIPALALKKAIDTAFIAVYWPITLFSSSSSNLNNFSLSLSRRLATGIPVHLDKTWEISSSVTSSLRRAPS